MKKDVIDEGSIFKTKRSGKLKVVKYNGANEIEVVFIDTGTTKITSADRIRKGNVKDHMYPSIFGIGYLGEGSYNYIEHKRYYSRWYSMLERCYGTKSKYVTYDDCSVAEIWHNFQNYAEWCKANYVAELQIDKDIRFRGNRIYSPENCSVVTHQENSAQANAKYFTIESPLGIQHKIYNLNQFCRDNGLRARKLYLAMRGDNVDTHGWKLLGHGQTL